MTTYYKAVRPDGTDFRSGAMPRPPKGIQHGTPGGHRTHRARGEDSCGPCTAAARAQNTRYNERKNAKRRIERASA